MISQFLIVIITWIRLFDSSVLAFHLSNNQWRTNRRNHRNSLTVKPYSNIQSCTLYSNGRVLAPVERWSDGRLVASSQTSAPAWLTNRLDDHVGEHRPQREHPQRQASIQSMLSCLAEVAIPSNHAEISSMVEGRAKGEARLSEISSSFRKILFLHEKNLGFLEEGMWEDLSNRYEAWWSTVNGVLGGPANSSMKSFQMHYRGTLMALEMLLDGYLSSMRQLGILIEQNDDCGDVEDEENRGRSLKERMTGSRGDIGEVQESLQVMYDVIEALLGDMREVYRRMEARGMLSRRKVDRGIDDDDRKAGVRLGRSESVIGNVCGMMEEVKRLYDEVNDRSEMREGSMIVKQPMSMMSRSAQMEKVKKAETMGTTSLASTPSAVGKEKYKSWFMDRTLQRCSHEQRRFLHELQRVSQSLQCGEEVTGARKRLAALLDLRRLVEHESATMPDDRGDIVDHSYAQLLTMEKLIYALFAVRHPSFRLPDYVTTKCHQQYLVHDAEDIPPNESVAEGYVRLVANLYPLFSSNSPVLRLLPAAPSWQDMKAKIETTVPAPKTQGRPEVDADRRLLSLPFYRYHGLTIETFSYLNKFLIGSHYLYFKPDSHVISFLFDYLDKLLDNYESLQSAPDEVRGSSLHQQMKRVYEYLIQDLMK